MFEHHALEGMARDEHEDEASAGAETAGVLDQRPWQQVDVDALVHDLDDLFVELLDSSEEHDELESTDEDHLAHGGVNPHVEHNHVAETKLNQCGSRTVAERQAAEGSRMAESILQRRKQRAQQICNPQKIRITPALRAARIRVRERG